MNYFAHLYLAQPTLESTVGNLLGDFAKGVSVEDLPAGVFAGLNNHRAVDRFTDAHPVTQELKKVFRPQRRRFAGIAIDVFFDHLLMQFWSQFESRLLGEEIGSYYDRMVGAQELMPSDRMRSTTARMVSNDWFGSYREINSIGEALDNIASRIRYPNQFGGAIEDIVRHRYLFEQGFLEFFPQLIDHVNALELETGANVDHSE